MLIVISYDIEKDRTRSRLAKKLKDFGPRVQKSVFEADIGEGE
ncbi:MAG: CRISPR-associated endonuclease Cas2, partial [Methanobacteriota archaeon]